MWTRDTLKKATQNRRDALANARDKVHRAALAYARYHNLTDEDPLDPVEAKAALDAAIDELTQEDFGDGVGEPVALLRALAICKQQREKEKPAEGRRGPSPGKDDDIER